MTSHSWVFVDQQLGMQAIDETSTTQNHPLGKRMKAKHNTYGEGEFLYAKGVASTVLGSWVVFSPDDWSTTLAVANAVGLLGVAMSANVASQYGWYQVFGKCPLGLCLASFADNGDVYLTSTAGSVDDADVAGDYVRGALGASARDTLTGGAEFELWYPQVADGKDN